MMPENCLGCYFFVWLELFHFLHYPFLLSHSWPYYYSLPFLAFSWLHSMWWDRTGNWKASQYPPRWERRGKEACSLKIQVDFSKSRPKLLFVSYHGSDGKVHGRTGTRELVHRQINTQFRLQSSPLLLILPSTNPDNTTQIHRYQGCKSTLCWSPCAGYKLRDTILMHFSFPAVLFSGLAPFQSRVNSSFPPKNSTPNMSEFNATAPSSPWWTFALAEPEPRKGAWASWPPHAEDQAHGCLAIGDWTIDHTSDLPLKYAGVDPRRFLSPYSSFTILALHFDFGKTPLIA